MLWLWLILACLVAAICVPPVVAAWEAWSTRATTADVGFWTLARSVAGTCHVPWGRRGWPIVRFPLRFGEGRLRVLRTPGRPGRTVEVRAYQQRSFGFSARICSPPAPPARWHAPGLAPVLLEAAGGLELAFCSLEATDERLLRWLLRHPETRRTIDGLQLQSNADALEIVLAGRVILLRAATTAPGAPGALVEGMAPELIEALRLLSDDLHDLACALEDAGEPMTLSILCRGCGARLGDDPWHCPKCGHSMHRGCREMTGGCANPACEAAPDALPAVIA
jgi:ribosomal protein L40E